MSGTRPERGWFEKADQDLEIARRALGPPSPLPAMACYHAQQCAEKYLKGYLTARSVHFRFVHDLVYPTQLCKEQEPVFKELMAAAEILGEYGTTVRYPLEEKKNQMRRRPERPFSWPDRLFRLWRSEHMMI